MDPKASERKELLRSALVRIAQLEKELEAATARREPIAVIGIGCRFPGGANDPESFWQLLVNGRDAITEIPPSRWKLDDVYDPDPDAPGKMYARHGGFIDDVDLFDPRFFGIAPREVPQMDPQQRLLLETSWTALEHAGIAPGSLLGSMTGVFIGLTTHDYARIQADAAGFNYIDTYFGTGAAGSVAAGRLSYVLGLRGPALTVDTACSSSLVAFHLACQSLRNGESRLALAGGVNLILSPEGHVIASRGRMLSPDGRCKTFDAGADGYVRSEGCGIVVLKRLSDAVADGDTVLAVVRGTALNQDGRSGGLTAPNGRAQEEVMRQALADAGIAPADVTYVETHGTGTSLGDPIEVQALGAVQGSSRDSGRPLLIGSVKTNVGHLEAAAGIAGVIKAVLSLYHGEIPPHLHFKTPNPYIPWDRLPIEVATQRRAWPTDGRRIVGVSSFGFSGTNAHVVLEAASPAPPRAAGSERPAQVLVLSAQSRPALLASADNMESALRQCAPDQLADFCFTAATGRSHFEERLAVVGTTPDEIAAGLAAFRRGEELPTLVHGVASLKRTPDVAFLFTGQGSQYVQMGRELYDTEPVFKAAIDRCNAVLEPRLGRSLLSVLYPEPPRVEDAGGLLSQTGWTQPALFAIEYALAELWRSWGVTPSVVLGHSVGEYVAACVAGVFSVEDGLALIAERARLMQQLPPGGVMVALSAGESAVAAAIAQVGGPVSIAAINAPDQTVVSGSREAVDAVIDRLGRTTLKATDLSVSHAFHSPLMEPMLDAFEQFARQFTYRAPSIPVISNVTGQAVEAPQTLDAAYWRRHARAAVRFNDSLAAARALGCRIFLEVGPHPTLVGLAMRGDAGSGVKGTASLRRGRSDWQQMLTALGALYVAGVPVEWRGLDRPGSRRKMHLPTYPFQRERFWFTRKPAAAPSSLSRRFEHPLLGARVTSPRLADIIFERDLEADSLIGIAQHRIFGQVVVPAAAYLEMALAAGRIALTNEQLGVHALKIHQPLVLSGATRTIQTVVTPDGDAGEVQIYSRDAGENGRNDGWTLHAAGRLVRAAADTANVTDTPSTPLDVTAYYDHLRACGVEYGPAFQGLTAISRGERTAIGTIVVPDVVDAEVNEYRLHPALLDACLQLMGVALPSSEGDDTAYLPIEVGEYVLSGRPAARMTCAASVAPLAAGSADTFAGDLTLRSEDGTLLASIRGLQFKRASRAALQRSAGHSIDDWMHEVQWQPLPDLPAAAAGPGRWLVFVDSRGVGDALVRELEAQGDSCVRVEHGDAFQEPRGSRAQVRPDNRDDIERLLSALPAGQLSGIVHTWSVDLGNPAGGAIDSVRARAIGTVSVLHLVQALAADGAARVPLAIVTQCAQPAGDSLPQISALQATVWGLGRVIAAELPTLDARMIDIGEGLSDVSLLAREIRSTDASEKQIALRGGRRLAARLVRSRPARSTPLPDGPFGLEIPQRGSLDNLVLKPLTPGGVGPGEIRIKVEASGLNFRDVLNTLGMYPGDPGNLGGEVVGTVDAIGEGVTRFAVGDPVLALTPRAFCSFVTTPEKLAFRRPSWLSVEEAATIPLVFQTAHYALNHIAGMRAGERVLIHAGAGGVGLAAIQLAQAKGAEVFATAGSPGKREYLRSLGVRHVMDSRSLSFADEVLEATGGEGVDIVLNSLAGEFIPKSLSLLRAGGRFLELGKTDLWDGARARAVNPNASYTVVFLGDACVSNPDLVETMFAELMALFEQKRLTPLPYRTWPIDRAAEAFRFMAQAKHTGKIVIQQTVSSTDTALQNDAAYLVTGAFGGLGLEVAKWMAERGAGHLILVGRRPPQDAAAAAVRAIEAAGTRVSVAAADVGDFTALRDIVAAIDPWTPLRGVVHAAGVLDDGTLMHQSAERFARVMRPKVDGAWNLHRLTVDRPLDFFVLFSAGAGLLGSPGQANYAAANTFLDGLAWLRRSMGLPAVSIDWGPWATVGMAARTDPGAMERWAAMGVDAIAPDRGIAAFERALAGERTQVAVLPVDWSRFLARRGPDSVPAFLRAVAEDAGASRALAPQADRRPRLLDRLAEAPEEDREELVVAFVREQVAAVLGIPAGSLRTDRGFAEMGMDSLMSVELSNRLGRSIGRNLPATLAFERSTIAALAQHLLDLLRAEAKPAATQTIRPAAPASDAGADNADLAGLSPEELERLLSAELNRAGY